MTPAPSEASERVKSESILDKHGRYGHLQPLMSLIHIKCKSLPALGLHERLYRGMSPTPCPPHSSEVVKNSEYIPYHECGLAWHGRNITWWHNASAAINACDVQMVSAYVATNLQGALQVHKSLMPPRYLMTQGGNGKMIPEASPDSDPSSNPSMRTRNFPLPKLSSTEARAHPPTLCGTYTAGTSDGSSILSVLCLLQAQCERLEAAQPGRLKQHEASRLVKIVD